MGETIMGESMYRLKFPCPCRADAKLVYWSHANNDCGGRIFLSKDADLVCADCYTLEFIQHWGFKCQNHQSHQGRYIKYEQSAIFAALSEAAQALMHDYNLTQTKAAKLLVVIQQKIMERWV